MHIKGHSIESCGTPLITDNGVDDTPFEKTDWDLAPKYDFTRLRKNNKQIKKKLMCGV